MTTPAPRAAGAAPDAPDATDGPAPAPTGSSQPTQPTEPGQLSEPTQPTAGSRRRRIVRRSLGVAAVGLLVGSHWVVEPVRVTSDSMTPTLHSGDRVLLLRSPWSGAVGRGDVVVIGPQWAERAAAASGAAGDGDGSSYVKRVVAVAGDVVALDDGALVVNGVHAVEPWMDAAALESMDGVWFGPVTVPEGSVYVLGDDRADSIDSRDLGPVPLTDVDGRVVTPWPLH